MLRTSELMRVLKMNEALGRSPGEPLCDRTLTRDKYEERHHKGRYAPKPNNSSSGPTPHYEEYADPETGENLLRLVAPPVERKIDPKTGMSYYQQKK